LTTDFLGAPEDDARRLAQQVKGYLDDRIGALEKRLPPGDPIAEGGGEGAEIRRLQKQVSITDFTRAAAAGARPVGAAAELSAALGAAEGANGGVVIPWAVLEGKSLPGMIQKTDVVTTVAEPDQSQRPILQRLFGRSVLDFLGVRIDSVPVGQSEYLLVNAGVAPAQRVESAAGPDSVALGLAATSLKPKRLTGKYIYSVEIMASTPAIEDAIRSDLRMAVDSAMSNAVINGAAVAPSTASSHANVEGFISALTQADDGSVADAARFAGLAAEAVDGLHADTEGQVRVLVGVSTYQLAAAVHLAGSGESGAELLMRRAGGFRSSSYIPAVSSHIQDSILWAGGGGTARGDSVAAMWGAGMEVIRDPYTKAAQGEVVLTWITLWDAAVAHRSGAYKSIGIKVSS